MQLIFVALNEKALRIMGYWLKQKMFSGPERWDFMKLDGTYT